MLEENKKNLDQGSDINDSLLITFLAGSLNKSADHVRHFDTQTNILIAIGLAILAFSVSQLNNFDIQIPMYILIISSVISIFFALYSVHPPKFMRKRGQEESLFYNKKIIDFVDSQTYAEEIKKISTDKNLLIKNYATEVYNLYKYYYRPKRKLFKISRDVLLLGIIFSIASYLVQIFIK
jgi:hypothetical protein